jgi:protein-arginine deiminase
MRLGPALLLPVLLAACDRSSGGGGGSAAAPAPPPPAGPVVDLDADSDRDGTVDDGDEPGEDPWTASAGAVFYHNLDDDNNDNLEDRSDTTLNGAADVLDLARILVRQYPVPAGGSVAVSVTPAGAQNAVRIFRNGSGSWSSVYASGASFTLPAADVEAGDVELGIEARARVSASWDGFVTLTLEIRDGSNAPVGTDAVTLRCAPWIMPTNLWTVEQLQVVNVGSGNASFRTVLASAAASAGSAYVEVPGGSYSNDQWLQDSHEPGILYLPKAGMPRRRVESVLQCDRNRPVDRWCKDALFGPDYDFIGRFGSALTPTSLNYGGNLEAIPPHTAPGGASYPWGRILIGGGTSAPIGGGTPVTRRMDLAYREFWNALKAQGPFLEVSTEWLAVGHVDEHTQVVPAPALARGWAFAFASPALARTILEQVQAGGGGTRTVFAGRGSSWQTTVNAILGDSALMAYNAEVQQRLDAIRAFYRAQVGLTDAEIIDLPVLFEDAGSGRAVAYSPGVVNLVTLPAANGTTYLVVPDPEGPDFPATDAWADETRRRLEALGTASRPVVVQFADVWNTYHVLSGEAHCGINTRRTPPADDWWNK